MLGSSTSILCVTDHYLSVKTGFISLTRFCQPVLLEGCSELEAQIQQVSRENTRLFFAELEQLGLSPQLQLDFVARPNDLDLKANGNPLQILDWRASATNFEIYGLFTTDFLAN